jgi:hypothetical protein
MWVARRRARGPGGGSGRPRRGGPVPRGGTGASAPRTPLTDRLLDRPPPGHGRSIRSFAVGAATRRLPPRGASVRSPPAARRSCDPGCRSRARAWAGSGSEPDVDLDAVHGIEIEIGPGERGASRSRQRRVKSRTRNGSSSESDLDPVSRRGSKSRSDSAHGPHRPPRRPAPVSSRPKGMSPRAFGLRVRRSEHSA